MSQIIQQAQKIGRHPLQPTLKPGPAVLQCGGITFVPSQHKHNVLLIPEGSEQVNLGFPTESVPRWITRPGLGELKCYLNPAWAAADYELDNEALRGGCYTLYKRDLTKPGADERDALEVGRLIIGSEAHRRLVRDEDRKPHHHRKGKTMFPPIDPTGGPLVEAFRELQRRDAMNTAQTPIPERP